MPTEDEVRAQQYRAAKLVEEEIKNKRRGKNISGLVILSALGIFLYYVIVFSKPSGP